MTTYIIIAAVVLIIGFLYLKSKGGDQSFNNLSVNNLGPLMKNKDTILIDVRTQNEISQGVIGKPLKIKLGPSMNKKLSTLDRNKKYVVYCRSGVRSAMASKMMVKMGFEDVNNLLGGYSAWNQR
ncbi:MAG: rhodanese-related sulfurtransferase [Saprospiraceae bacterium]|jgi:rhodanese-related sulfurtransferase